MATLDDVHVHNKLYVDYNGNEGSIDDAQPYCVCLQRRYHVIDDNVYAATA